MGGGAGRQTHMAECGLRCVCVCVRGGVWGVVVGVWDGGGREGGDVHGCVYVNLFTSFMGKTGWIACCGHCQHDERAGSYEKVPLHSHVLRHREVHACRDSCLNTHSFIYCFPRRSKSWFLFVSIG